MGRIIAISGLVIMWIGLIWDLRTDYDPFRDKGRTIREESLAIQRNKKNKIARIMYGAGVIIAMVPVLINWR